MKKLHYDYSVGLNTPYWIQEIRTPKGKLITYFSSPMELSFFVVFLFVLLLMIFLRSWMEFLAGVSFGISNLLWLYAPYKLSRLYCECEPDGKKMHLFLADVWVYVVLFVMNTKGIYQGQRVKPIVGTVIFEQTKL